MKSTSQALRVMLCIVGLAGAAGVDCAAGAEAVTVPPLRYVRRDLANGLRVYALRDSTTPNVTVQVWYEVGAKHDPEGRSGFAHLFEHILSRKTRNMSLNMVNQLTEDVGGSRNASTGDDRTNYFEIVPAAWLETMLWTHAERMARPVVDQQVFETERSVVKEELRQRYLAPSYGRLYGFVIRENAFDTLPHRRPPIGNIAELDAATLDDARAFHETYYGPDTATLIVSGNFDPARLETWIDHYFAGIPRRARPVSLEIPRDQPPRSGPRAVTAYAPNVPLPAIASVWPLPMVTHPDTPALTVLDAILGRGESSRLEHALVQGKGLASRVSTDLSLLEDGGYLMVSAILAGGRSVDEVEGALRAVMERLREAPVSAAELAEAKNELLAGELRGRETFAGRAFLLGEALVQTGDPEWPDRLLTAIQKVTADDVWRAARLHLADTGRVDIRYLDEALRPAGEADNWRNPVPMPKFSPLAASTRAPIELAPEGERQAPPDPAGAIPVRPPELAEQTLANGLKVVSARTGDVPLVSLALVVGGGSAVEPPGLAGVAALSAEVMLKGTQTRSAEELAREIESLGAEIGAQAGADGVTLSIDVPLQNLEAVGLLLADIVQAPAFPAAEFERERSRALDAWSVTMKNPGSLAALVSQRALYGAAPYGAPIGGTAASLKRLTREDLVRYHADWWRPDNATLVVTGGVDGRRAQALAATILGSWRAAGAPVASRPDPAGTRQPVRTVVIDLPGAGQAAVAATLRALPRSDPGYYALTAANAVLGVGSTGRLFQEVRVKRALSYGAYSASPNRRAESSLTASAQTKNESAADVARVFLDELDRLKNEPLEIAAVEKRKAFVVGGFNRQTQSAAGLAGVLAGLVQQGMPAAEATLYAARMGGVDAEAASTVARRLVGSEQATLTIVGDASKFIDALRLIRPDVDVIPIDLLDLDQPGLRR